MSRNLNIAGVDINDDSECFVIAEIGHNHQGDLDKCKALMRSAHECGVHAVKLQKRQNKSLFTQAVYNAPYDNRNSFGDTYGEHREFLEFEREEYEELKNFCDDLGIIFFATAFDVPSAQMLSDLDMPAYKIASGDLKNLPLLRYVAEIGKPIILSTGGGNMNDVIRAYETIHPINNQLCIMQCTSGYPTVFEEINLRVLEAFREQFPDVVIGYSGHENGIAIPVAAYVLGARIVEKHFTLDRTWKGTDQAISLGPNGLRRMVRDLIRTRVSMGIAEKHTFSSEIEPLKKQIKYIVATRPIAVGEVLTEDDVACRIAQGIGLQPDHLDEVLGRRLTAALNVDDLVTQDVLANE